MKFNKLPLAMAISVAALSLTDCDSGIDILPAVNDGGSYSSPNRLPASQLDASED